MSLARERFRRGRAVPWSPHVLTRSIWRAGWYSEIGVTESGGVVQTWTDYIGGLAPTQATVGSRPALDTSGDYPVITAAAGSRFLRLAGSVINGVIPTGTETCCVFGVISGFTTGNVFSYGGTSAATNRRLGVTTSNAISLAAGGSGAGYNIAVERTVPLGPTLVSGIMTASALTLRLDGAEVGRVEVAMPSTGTDNITLFANTNSTASGFGDGAISDLHITRALSDADVLRFEGWLAHERGLFLADGHPYRSSAP